MSCIGHLTKDLRPALFSKLKPSIYKSEGFNSFCTLDTLFFYGELVETDYIYVAVACIGDVS